MSNKLNKLATSFVVLVALAACGCGTFENPDADAATTDNGTDTMQMDAGNSADVSNDSSPDIGQQGTDATSQDLGNQDTAQPAPDVQQVQQVEVAQEVSVVNAGPKPECANDADCNDNNSCTGDICVVGGVCKHMAIAAACDDNNACTDNDTCTAGACKGTAKVCADNNPCTDDFCVNGVCAHGVNTVGCDDGNACTSSDKCDATKCIGTVVECDDKNPCTTDTCDKAKGCAFTPVLCEDGDPCTTDSCDSKTGNCSFAQKVCDDGKAYTYDWCSVSDYYGQPGSCVSQEKWNGCAKDSDCEDGNKCTINVCNSLSGTCKTVYENCDDDDYCTSDSCVPAKGCVNAAINCDDYNPCTTNWCSDGSCYNLQVNCNDSDPNTADSCNANTGACVHTPTMINPPPPGSGTVNVSVNCGAVACEGHLFFGTQANGSAFDNFGLASANSSFVVDLPKSQLCSWGLEVAARLNTATWPWLGCDPTAPSLNTLIVKINGVVLQGVLTKHPWTCNGGGEGNLAFTKQQLGCP